MPEHASREGRWSLLPLLAGPLSMLLLETLAGPGWPERTMLHVAGIAIWMSIWWVSEAVPLAVTALLPFVFFPLFGVLGAGETASQYFNSTVFLFIGGFMMAFALERWKLHRRIASVVLSLFGNRPAMLLLGVMLATAFISMWMSNTAVALLMLPVALALCGLPGEGDGTAGGLATALVLGVVYSSSIGGIGTPLGSPPNLVFLRIHSMSFPDAPQLGFLQWMLFCVPLMLLCLAACWLLLRARFLPAAEALPVVIDSMQTNRREPLNREQILTGGIFLLSALLWLTRAPLTIGSLHFGGWGTLFADAEGISLVDDGTVAMLATLLLFVLPASRRAGGGALLRWEDAKRLPWGIVLLFGGGFALAEGVLGSGLADWAGGKMVLLGALPPLLLVLLCYGLTTLLGELASNTAVAQMVLPIVAGLAAIAGIPPLLLMMPVTLGSSLDFILPSATPPNAIALASGHVTVRQLVSAGLLLELSCAILVVAVMWLLGGPLLGI